MSGLGSYPPVGYPAVKQPAGTLSQSPPDSGLIRPKRINQPPDLRLGLADLPVPGMSSYTTGPMTAPLATSGFSFTTSGPAGLATPQPIAPAMSPLDVLALHSRRLAERFDEPMRAGRADRPLSRLPPGEVASELGRSQSHGRPDSEVYRAISPGPVSPRSPKPIMSLDRPVSHYPQFGSVDDVSDFDFGPNGFSIPRASSPEEMGADEQAKSAAASVHGSSSQSSQLVQMSGSSTSSAAALPASLRPGLGVERIRSGSGSSAGTSPTSPKPFLAPGSHPGLSRRPSPTPLSRSMSPIQTSLPTGAISVPTSASPARGSPSQPRSDSAASNRRALNFSRPRSMMPGGGSTDQLPVPVRQMSADSHSSRPSAGTLSSRQNSTDQPVTPLRSDAPAPIAGFAVIPAALAAAPGHRTKLPPTAEESPASSFVYSTFHIPTGKTEPEVTAEQIMEKEFTAEGLRASTLGASLGINLAADPLQARQRKTEPERSHTPPVSPGSNSSRPGTSAGRKLRKNPPSRAAPPMIDTSSTAHSSRPLPSKGHTPTGDLAVPTLLRPNPRSSRAGRSPGRSSSPPTPPRSGYRPETGAARPSLGGAAGGDRPGRIRPMTAGAAGGEGLSVEDHLEKGIEHHEQGDLPKATYHWRLSAQGGHPTAMLLYAIACRHGWGMRPNPSEGVRWLQMAVDSAQLEVAEDQDLVKKGGPGPTSALKTHKAQFALSVYELGVSYMNGWGVKQDRSLAVRCFEVAGNWGDGDALCEAAKCYAEGIGVRKKDLHKAAKLYRMAEDKGVHVAGNSWIHKDKYLGDPPSAKVDGKENTGVKKWFRMGETA